MVESLKDYVKENLRDDVLSIISNPSINISSQVLKKIKLALMSGDSTVAEPFIKEKNISEEQYDLFVKKFEKDDNYEVLSVVLGQGGLVDGSQILSGQTGILYDQIISQCSNLINTQNQKIVITDDLLQNLARINIARRSVSVGSYEVMLACLIKGCKMCQGKGDVEFNNDVFEVKCDEWIPVSMNKPNIIGFKQTISEEFGIKVETVKNKSQAGAMWNSLKDKITVDGFKKALLIIYENSDTDLIDEYAQFVCSNAGGLDRDDFLKSFSFWGLLQYKKNSEFNKLISFKEITNSKYRIISDWMNERFVDFWTTYNKYYKVTTGFDDRDARFYFPKLKLV